MIKIAFLIWEPLQIEYILEYYGEEYFSNNDIAIIALDYRVIPKLKELDITYKSVADYISYEDMFEDLDVKAIDYTNKIIKEIDFLSHKNIEIGKIIKFMLSYYLGKVFYLIEIFKKIFFKNNFKKVVIPKLINNSFDFWHEFSYRIPEHLLEEFAYIKNMKVEYLNINSFKKRENINQKINNFFRENILSIAPKLTTAINQQIDNYEGKNILVLNSWSRVASIIKRIEDVNRIIFFSSNSNNRGFKEVFLQDFSEIVDKNIEFYNEKDIKNKEIENIMKQKTDYFIEQWNKFKNKIGFESKLKYKGINFSRCIIKLLDEFMTSQVSKKIMEIEAINYILKERKIDLSILRIDSRDEYKITALFGKQLEIPSVEIQHGLIGESNTSIAFVPVTVDKIMTYGKLTKQILLKHGVDSDKICTVGNPRLEKNYKLDIIEKKPFQNNNTILYALTNVMHGNRRTFVNYLSTTFDLVNHFKLLNLALDEISLDDFFVKLHPGDPREKLHSNLIKQYLRNNIEIYKNIDIKKLLIKSSILITYPSTVVLEAMILDTPVIVLNLKDEKNLFQQAEKEKAVITVNNKVELTNAIKWLIQDKNNRRRIINNAKSFLDKYYSFNKNSSDQIAEIINDML